MSNPPPEKLARLMVREQSRWKQPERRLVEDGGIALLRGLWIQSRDEVLGLQNDFCTAKQAVAAIEERLPVVRDIDFWVRDPAAGLPFSLFADVLGSSAEELAKELFKGMCPEVLAVVENKEPLRCPLCERKK